MAYKVKTYFFLKSFSKHPCDVRTLVILFRQTEIDLPYPLVYSPMGLKMLPQKRTVIIITVLFWNNTFTPMGLH